MPMPQPSTMNASGVGSLGGSLANLMGGLLGGMPLNTTFNASGTPHTSGMLGPGGLLSETIGDSPMGALGAKAVVSEATPSGEVVTETTETHPDGTICKTELVMNGGQVRKNVTTCKKAAEEEEVTQRRLQLIPPFLTGGSGGVPG